MCFYYSTSPFRMQTTLFLFTLRLWIYVIIFLFKFLFILLFVGQKVIKKPSLLKKLNGSILNQFATCSACGTRLLRKLKQSSANAASALIISLPIFWMSRFVQIRTLGKLLWTIAMLPKFLRIQNYKLYFYNKHLRSKIYARARH